MHPHGTRWRAGGAPRTLMPYHVLILQRNTVIHDLMTCEAELKRMMPCVCHAVIAGGHTTILKWPYADLKCLNPPLCSRWCWPRRCGPRRGEG
jgi:hypothetical protein